MTSIHDTRWFLIIEEKFSLIKDFQGFKHHSLRGKRMSADISLHSESSYYMEKEQALTLGIPIHTHIHT